MATENLRRHGSNIVEQVNDDGRRRQPEEIPQFNGGGLLQPPQVRQGGVGECVFELGAYLFTRRRRWSFGFQQCFFKLLIVVVYGSPAHFLFSSFFIVVFRSAEWVLKSSYIYIFMLCGLDQFWVFSEVIFTPEFSSSKELY